MNFFGTSSHTGNYTQTQVHDMVTPVEVAAKRIANQYSASVRPLIAAADSAHVKDEQSSYDLALARHDNAPTSTIRALERTATAAHSRALTTAARLASQQAKNRAGVDRELSRLPQDPQAVQETVNAEFTADWKASFYGKTEQGTLEWKSSSDERTRIAAANRIIREARGDTDGYIRNIGR